MIHRFAGLVRWGEEVKQGLLFRLEEDSSVAEGASVARRDPVREGSIECVVDGSFFNHPAGESPAETLKTLYRKRGFEEAMREINGDFACVLFDRETRTLWLGRDRFGTRPLYFTCGRGVLGFASRLSSLLAQRGVSHDLNRQFVALFAGSHYRYFDNSPEESPYQDISQLPAAHWLCLRDGEVRKQRYWHLEDAPDFGEGEHVLAGYYRDLLMDAVDIRLRHARNPAFTLSGGMDSSSVLASAVRTAGEKRHAFSAVYSDKTYDETAEIRSMLAEQVAEWHPVAVDEPDVFGLVRRMIAANDEPVATATWLSHFLICEEVSKQGFGSLFGGLGGDELNAGEYEHFLFFFADLRAAGQEERLRKEVEMWARYHDHPIYRKSFEVMEASLPRLVDFSVPGRCRPDRARLTRYARALNRDYFNLETFEPVMDTVFTSYLKNRTYQDLFRETIPCCLRAEDRQAAAFDLDHFDPFFDHRLVEFMFRVPGTLKYRDGVTKHLLREAMRGVLPEETRTRVKKTGWNAPAHLWFSGKALDSLRDMAHSQAFRDRGVYNAGEVLRLIDEHEQIVAGSQVRENHMMFLWQVVNLELWFQGMIDSRRPVTRVPRSPVESESPRGSQQ